MLQLSEMRLDFLLEQRETTRRSYADLAELHLGDRTLGTELRSVLRSYKRTSRATMLDPIRKLFADAITLPTEPILVISDTHCPYQNKELLLNAFRIAQERGIKTLVHAGDLIDGAAYNTQAKHEQVPPIELEIEHARSLLYCALSYFDKLYIIPGNHDAHYFHKEKISFTSFIHDVILNGQYTTRVITTDHDFIYYSDFAIIGHLTNGYDMIPGKIATQLAIKYNMHSLVGHDHLFGAIQAENGKYGISIGASFVPGSFSYKAKAYNVFPNTGLGFVIIMDNKIHHFDELLNERIYE